MSYQIWITDILWYHSWSIVKFSFDFFDKDSNFESYSDNDVIDSILKWNKNDFYLIIDRYWDKIYRYIYYHFNFDKNITSDLTQDVFFHVLQKIDKFDNTQKFEPWLYRVAHNCCLDWIRKNKNNLSESSLDDISYNIWEDFDDNDLESSYKKELLFKILDSLDYKYRQVVLLSYFEQKSYDEISYIMWISKAAVWTNLSRARKKIKDIIEKNELLKDAIMIDSEFDL